MKEPLRQKVAEFVSEGEFDSRGRFSLDLERARVKLARWQMAHPWDWMLKGIQAAVAAGVRMVVLRQSRLGEQMEWEHFQAPPEWVEQLPELLSGPLASEHPLYHLALAFRGAPGKVSLQLAGQQLEWCDGWLRQQRLAHSQSRLESMRPDPPNWAVWLWQSLRGQRPELEAVRQRARYCPIGLALNGRLVRPVPLARSLLDLRFRARDAFCRDVLALPYRPRSVVHDARPVPSGLAQRLGHSKPLRGNALDPVLWLRIPVRPSGPAQLVLVRLGITCQPLELDMGLPGLEIVMTAPGLGLDLSEFGLARSRELDKLVTGIGELVREELRQSRDRLRAAPNKLQEAWHEAFPWLGLKARSRRSELTGPQVLRELPPARMLPEHDRPPSATDPNGHRPRPGRGRRPRG